MARGQPQRMASMAKTTTDARLLMTPRANVAICGEREVAVEPGAAADDHKIPCSACADGAGLAVPGTSVWNVVIAFCAVCEQKSEFHA